MEYEGLLLEKKDYIATITLNRPDQLNTLGGGIRDNLPLVADELAKDNEVRVVILTGAGRAFSAGADVGGQARLADQVGGGQPTAESRYDLIRFGGWICDIFPQLDKPVICAVNGVAAGVGFSLAMSCDIRIASETARFYIAQIARGLVADGGLTFFLPRILGLSKALELMFTPEQIGAAEAERLGIVSRVVPANELMTVTRELAIKIAQQAPVSLALCKKIVWRGAMEELARQHELETWANRICRATEDVKEGMRSFLEKRPAQFQGR